VLLWLCLSFERDVALLKPGTLEEARKAEGCVINGVNTVKFHFDAFFAENAGCDASDALGAVFGDVGVATFGAAGQVLAPLAKVAHFKALETLRGLGFEL
jgi:hypothetical protein